MDRLFISSQDDLQCVKADPEDGWGTDGSYTPDSERANNTDASPYARGCASTCLLMLMLMPTLMFCCSA